MRLFVIDSKTGLFRSSGQMMDQFSLQDHMMSHYRKLYSAKAAVDCSTPTSMLKNVKYVDQKRRGSAPPTSQSHTRIQSRSSTRSKHSGHSVQGGRGLCHYLDQSEMSSPRVKAGRCPSQTGFSSRGPADPHRAASEMRYESPEPQWQRSCSASAGPRHKSFQGPWQKTYSGDLLQKHARLFTPEKPFTPRTLRSDHASSLKQYRYYTPPRRKAGGASGQCKQASPQLQSPQAYSVDLDWSEEEGDLFKDPTHTRPSRDAPLSSSRVSPEGMKSPVSRRVSVEEEELLYLEFIADVTSDILSQGLFSDRVLTRLFQRHIHLNKHRLDKNKMQLLLDDLQKDLQTPIGASTPSEDEAGPPGDSPDPTEQARGEQLEKEHLRNSEEDKGLLRSHGRDEEEHIRNSEEDEGQLRPHSRSEEEHLRNSEEDQGQSNPHGGDEEEHLRNSEEEDERQLHPHSRSEEEHIRNSEEDEGQPNPHGISEEDHLRNSEEDEGQPNPHGINEEDHLRNSEADEQQMEDLEKSVAQCSLASAGHSSDEDF